LKEVIQNPGSEFGTGIIFQKPGSPRFIGMFAICSMLSGMIEGLLIVGFALVLRETHIAVKIIRTGKMPTKDNNFFIV
jgi:hypothetical protein